MAKNVGLWGTFWGSQGPVQCENFPGQRVLPDNIKRGSFNVNCRCPGSICIKLFYCIIMRYHGATVSLQQLLIIGD